MVRDDQLYMRERVKQILADALDMEVGGEAEIVVRYTLHCPDSFVTTNWVSPDLLVLNGSATNITPVGSGERRHEVWDNDQSDSGNVPVYCQHQFRCQSR